MKCPNCGEEMNEQDRVCPFCGAEAATEITGTAAEEAAPETADPEENTETPEQTSAPAPEKKNGKFVAVAVAVVAAAGIGAFGYMKMTEKDPKQTVIDAFKSLNPEDQVSPLEEMIGYSKLAETISQGNEEAGFSLTFESCSDETANSFAGSGFSADEKYDRENQKLSVDFGAVYNGMDLLNMNIYYGDEKLMAAIPELMDPVFVADLSDGLAERIEDSPVFGPMVEEENIDIEGLMDYVKESMELAQTVDSSDPYDLEGLLERYREGCKAQESFKAAMTVEKAEKGKFQIDGQEVSCKGYHVYISKDSMIEFLRTSSDFFLQDEQFRQAYLENLERGTKVLGFLGNDMQGFSAKELQEQAYEEASAQVAEVIDKLDGALQDVEMMVYVDKKGRLAAADGSTSLLREGDEAVDIRFSMKLKGGSRLTENYEVTFTAEDSAGREEAVLVKSGSYDGKQVSADYQVNLTMSDKTGTQTGDLGEVAFHVSGQYSSETGDYRVDGDVSTDGTKQGSLVISGVIDETGKDNSFHCTMDEIRLNVDSEDFEVVLSGEYYLRPLSSEITEPEGEPMDIFAATEEDWQNVIMQAYYRGMGLFGGLGIQ